MNPPLGPRLLRSVLAATAATSFALPVAGWVAAGAATTPESRASAQRTASTTACAALVGLPIPARRLGLPTSGGEVTAARNAPASGSGAAATPAHCLVDAAIHPVDPAAPDILMRVALPHDWNGGALMFGGGGYNGTIPNVAQNVPFGPVDQPTPLGRGYATFASDSGHQADTANHPIPSLDGSWAVNDEAVRNFSGDALKKVRDAALVIVRAAYGAKPERLYFAGGSTGGREALAVAQRWPKDFDGVIAAYPAWNAATLDLFFGYATHVLGAPGAFPGPAEQRLLEDSVMAACDPDDGVVDGLISDEAGCDFDPQALLCPAGTRPGATCLSQEQIDAVVAVSSPMRLGYEVASGEWGYPGFPLLSGASMSTPILGWGTTPPAEPMPVTAGYGTQFWTQWVKYFVTRDPATGPFDLDPLDPGEWQDRISELTALQDVNDADLAPFARAGGKLLLVHGAADELVSHRSTVEYYERVRAAVGDRRTDRFARFYLVPGANHANFPPVDFSAAWDSLTALEEWVEEGVAPADQVVADGDPARGLRTRPLCEWPTWPAYVGGDPAEADSFTCRE